MDTILYVLLGLFIGGLLIVAFLRPEWRKYIFAGIGLLLGGGITYAVSQRQRRLRELGVSADTAQHIAVLLAQREHIVRAAETLRGEATKDQQLRDVQRKIEAELKAIPAHEVNVEAIRNEIRHAWPTF